MSFRKQHRVSIGICLHILEHKEAPLMAIQSSKVSQYPEDMQMHM